MKKNTITVALIGNPNTGKTSLLNALTGQSLHVGNWSGKTIEKREGTVSYAGYDIRIVDLPGTYSLLPYSEEEVIAHDFIAGDEPDIILQIIDVNALERNLLLTMELLAMGKKMILAFNFNKEAAGRGLTIDYPKIKKALGLPIVRIEADAGEHNQALLKQIVQTHKGRRVIPAYVARLRKNKREIKHSTAFSFIKSHIRPLCVFDKRITFSDKIDAIILHKYLSWPIFLAVVLLMFKAVFLLSQPLVSGINLVISQLGAAVYAFALPPLLLSFLVEGLLGGVGTVITFVPLIFMLFLFITILEDSGYLARSVVLFDKLYRKFGVSGKSFIPTILGFGCNVPAILATRTIKNKKERLIAIFVAPFMSCSARLPVFILFAGIFFPQHATVVVMLLYLFGVATALLVGLVMSKLIKSNESNTLIIELPPYRRPSAYNILKHALSQTISFVKRVGTIILVFVALTWLLGSLPLGVTYASETSVLGVFGKAIAPVFEPLGFGYWPFAVALMLGFLAKENAIGILATIYHGSGYAVFDSILKANLTTAGALSFMVFVLLYIPCLATIIAVKRETASYRFAFVQVVVTLSIAWAASFLTYRLAAWLL